MSRACCSGGRDPAGDEGCTRRGHVLPVAPDALPLTARAMSRSPCGWRAMDGASPVADDREGAGWAVPLLSHPPVPATRAEPTRTAHAIFEFRTIRPRLDLTSPEGPTSLIRLAAPVVHDGYLVLWDECRLDDLARPLGEVSGEFLVAGAEGVVLALDAAGLLDLVDAADGRRAPGVDRALGRRIADTGQRAGALAAQEDRVLSLGAVDAAAGLGG